MVGLETDPAARLRQGWGRKIREVRQLREMSRSELARRLDVSAAAVGQWERGETTPRPHLQIAIARELEVPHGVLFPMEGVA